MDALSSRLVTLESSRWNEVFSKDTQAAALSSLEKGKILLFPNLIFPFSLQEKFLFSPHIADKKNKNVSFLLHRPHELKGIHPHFKSSHPLLSNLLMRYAKNTIFLIQQLLPRYANFLTVARTSFRPVEIKNRYVASYRKDDKRLHVDAFPSSPNQGSRILRVFCNVNPHNQARIWRIGEPFEVVAKKFLPRIASPLPGLARILQSLRITKSYRTPYDHYMLHLHDYMKKDATYQKEAAQEEIHFSAGSSWIVQTDDVSHAAMEGQYVLEQTFHLPVSAMQRPEFSPLAVLEKLLNRSLI